MASFKWKLKSLSFGGQEVSYHLDGDFFNQIESTEVGAASIDVAMEVVRKSDTQFEFDFRCTGSLTIPCDRCLNDMVHAVDTTYHLCVTQEGNVLDDSGDGQLVVPESWNELDVAPIIRDTVLLSIPIVHTHAPGECDPIVMAKLEQFEATGDDDDTASDEHKPIDPRWEALRQLKNEQ